MLRNCMYAHVAAQAADELAKASGIATSFRDIVSRFNQSSSFFISGFSQFNFYRAWSTANRQVLKSSFNIMVYGAGCACDWIFDLISSVSTATNENWLGHFFYWTRFDTLTFKAKQRGRQRRQNTLQTYNKNKHYKSCDYDRFIDLVWLMRAEKSQ